MQLIDNLKKFQELLDRLPDKPNHAFDFYSFFRSLHMAGYDSVPFIELSTILKYKKPAVFYELRKQYGHNNLINMLTSVDMDLDEAQSNIAKISEPKSD